MPQRTCSFCAAGAASLLACFGQPAVGAPSIALVTSTLDHQTLSATSGTLDHRSTITISGAGFGTKPAAAPLAWDDASGTSTSAIWDGAWPSKISQYNMAYRTPQRGIALPHNHVTRYIAGAHGEKRGADGGSNVMVYKNVTLPATFPYYVYASWYQRADDAWVFGGDNNFKTFDYSTGSDPYANSNWYLGYGPPHPASTSDSPQWGPNDDGKSLMNPDMNGHNYWWNHGVNPMSGKWSKVEVEIKLTDQNDGFIRVTENASHVLINYVGPTDKYPGKTRTIGIGGYARMTGQPNNWRYYADVYLDTTLARVVLANNADLSKATIVETQLPVSWNDGSIDTGVNLGQFAEGQTAYLFVFDPTGAHNDKGFAVRAGTGIAATSATGEPNAPGNVAVH
jgi:hypothetical protein